MSKQFLVVLVVIILGLFGIFTLTKDKSSSKTNNGKTSSSQTSKNVIGLNKKKVVLLEYGDYQCPACGAYYPLTKQIISQYKNDIQFQFKNFPLQQIHPNARAGARAAEAAAKQGKFWEMHDMLYEQQKVWESSTAVNPIFEGFASQIGLNVTKYKTDFDSNAINDIINADLEEGNKLGIDSTPSFFIQGKKIDPLPQDMAGFQKLIDQAIKNSK